MMLAPPHLMHYIQVMLSSPPLPVPVDAPSTYHDILLLGCSEASSHPTPPGHRPDITTLDDATARFRFRFTINEMRSLVTALGLPPTYTVHRVT